jgi:hypothetical protein
MEVIKESISEVDSTTLYGRIVARGNLQFIVVSESWLGSGIHHTDKALLLWEVREGKCIWKTFDLAGLKPDTQVQHYDHHVSRPCKTIFVLNFLKYIVMCMSDNRRGLD